MIVLWDECGVRWTRKTNRFILTEMGFTHIEQCTVRVGDSSLLILTAQKGGRTYEGKGISPRLAFEDFLENYMKEV